MHSAARSRPAFVGRNSAEAWRAQQPVAPVRRPTIWVLYPALTRWVATLFCLLLLGMLVERYGPKPAPAANPETASESRPRSQSEPYYSDTTTL